MKIKNYNVLFAISSCKGFYEATIDKNIWSLLEAGVERDSILLVMGDFQDPIEASNKEVELRNKFGIDKIYCEQQNSFEYTPMIHIVENLSMNIGLYKISWLIGQVDRVLNCKNTSTDPRIIQLKKQWGVDFEDHLLKYQDGNFTELCGSRDQTIQIENPYGTNTPRRIRNFQYLDIYKAQSNWNGRLSEMNVTV